VNRSITVVQIKKSELKGLKGGDSLDKKAEAE
jgi:hypothetical protein